MKLKGIVADAGGGGGYPAHGASAAAFAAPYTALAEGGTHAAAAVERAAVIQGNVEEEKRRIQIRGDATETKAALMVELEQLQSTLQTTETDPDVYATKYAEGVAALRKTVPERVKYPESVELLKPELALLFGRDQVQANAHTNKLFKGAVTAQLDRTVEMQLTTAQGIPIGDHQAWSDQFRESVKAIGEATWLSPEQRQKRLADTRKRYFEDRAEQHARQDPAGFLAAEQRGDYRGIDNTRIDSLVGKSTTRLDSDRKEEQRLADKQEAAMQKAAVEAREFTTSDLLAKARGKTLDQYELEDARRLRLIDSHQYQRIVDVMSKPADEGPSDAATLRRVVADTHSIRPRMSEAQLNDLRDRGLLNTKDWKDGLDRRRETIEALGREADSKQRQNLQSRHSQAEQELRAALGIPTLFDKLEPAKEKAYEFGLRELRSRSGFYDGKEDPLVALQDIRARTQSILAAETKVSDDQITKLLPGIVQPGTAGALKASQELEAKRSTMPAALYDQQRRMLLDLIRLRTEAERYTTPTTTPTAAPKPGAQPVGVGVGPRDANGRLR